MRHSCTLAPLILPFCSSLISCALAVAWEVEMSDGRDEVVWWAASLVSDEEEGGDGGAHLTYDPKHGFDAETRRVVFLENSLLW